MTFARPLPTPDSFRTRRDGLVEPEPRDEYLAHIEEQVPHHPPPRPSQA